MLNISVPKKQLAEFCRANHIRRLSVFGSALRDDFSADSEGDVLVEFDPNHVPGLIAFIGMQSKLSPLFGNRKIDLGTFASIKPYLRDKILKSARVQYERTR